MPARYLRISITSRCNLHCFYCRDAEECAGAEKEPEVAHLALLARCAAAEGVQKVRITGGEPLVRGDLTEIVQAVSSVPGIAETTLTTNGIGLAQRAEELRRAGLDRVNISLDTLVAERFRAITGEAGHGRVLAAIETCLRTFDQVKLNTVLLPGVNDDEVESLVEFAAERGLWVRFIERYTCGRHCPDGNERVSMQTVKARLEQVWGELEPVASSHLSVEESYRTPGASGARVGLIASVSNPPCETCTRLRFTAASELLPCLFAESGIDVSGALGDEDAGAVRHAIRRAYKLKRGRSPSLAPSLSIPVSRIGG